MSWLGSSAGLFNYSAAVVGTSYNDFMALGSVARISRVVLEYIFESSYCDIHPMFSMAYIIAFSCSIG